MFLLNLSCCVSSADDPATPSSSGMVSSSNCKNSSSSCAIITLSSSVSSSDSSDLQDLQIKNKESLKKHLYAFGTEATQKSYGKKKSGRRINVQVMSISRQKYKSHGRYAANKGRRPARSQLYVKSFTLSTLTCTKEKKTETFSERCCRIKHCCC